MFHWLRKDTSFIMEMVYTIFKSFYFQFHPHILYVTGTGFIFGVNDHYQQFVFYKYG